MKINQNFQLCSINLILIFEKSFRPKLSLWVAYTTIPTLGKKVQFGRYGSNIFGFSGKSASNLSRFLGTAHFFYFFIDIK